MQCVECFCRALQIPLQRKMDQENVRLLVNQHDLCYSSDDIIDVPTPDLPPHQSVTAVLLYCKKNIVNPYLRLLGVMGLRPFSFDPTHRSFLLDLANHYYTLQVVVFIVLGYVLQYMACFRRDRGFCYVKYTDEPVSVEDPFFHSYSMEASVTAQKMYEKICQGSLMFSFVIPDVLHLIAYIYAVAAFRSSDDDQLPSLMERVFLASSNLSDGFSSQKKLVKTLWIFVVISGVWMLLSFISVNVMMEEGTIEFKWMESRSSQLLLFLKILLVICTLWHDMIQATVVSNYCLQAQLITSYVQFLRSELLQYPIEPVKWMRDIEDFKKILKYFNEEISPAVCIFTFINISCAFSGIIWLLNYDKLDKDTYSIVVISVLNVCLWIMISVAPFIQAARLTSACRNLTEVGHEVRIKPFVHQDTPGYELDSILLYATTLKVNARLFCMPIESRYLCFGIVSASILLLVLGQCHYLN